MNAKRLLQLAAPLLLLLLLPACAQKQWRDPLLAEEAEQARDMLVKEQEKRSVCSCCLDAEITATWDSSFSDGGLIGYLQVMLPSSFKLVAVNPLGQPLFALTTDGKHFQTINAVKGVYKHGKVASFVKRHDIPEDILHDQWGKWLTGSLAFDPENIIALHRDEAARGIWIALEKPQSTSFSREYLLYDLQRKALLERVAYDAQGDEAARVIYGRWSDYAGCPLPTSIEVQGTSYGTTIAIELKDILTDRNFTEETFSLKLPPGYLRQYYP